MGCGYVDASLLRKLHFSILFSSAPKWLRELLLQKLLLVQNKTKSISAEIDLVYKVAAALQ